MWQELKPQLSREQFERLVGLALQAHGCSALLHDEIVTSLQLSTDPRPTLCQSLRNQQDWPRLCADFQTSLAADLSDEVKARLEEMKGAPFHFSPPLPLQSRSTACVNSMGGMDILGPLAALVMQSEVQEDLKLSNAVIGDVTALIDDLSQVAAIELRDSDWRFEPGSSEPELPARWRAIVEKFEANRSRLESELETLLGKEKFQRLVGLLWQREGYRALLVSHAAAMSLELSDHQLAELLELKSNFLQHRNMSRLTLSSLPSVDLVSILTSEQKDQIERLEGVSIIFGESPAEMAARASAAYRRASDASRNGEYSASVKEYDEAIRLFPKNTTYINNRSMIRQRLGLLQEALEDHNKALELNPRYSAGYYQRFKALLSLGEIDRAIEDARELANLEPTTRNYQLLAMALAEAGQPSAAAEAYVLAAESHVSTDGQSNAQIPHAIRSLSPPLVASQSAFAGEAISGWYPTWSPDGKEIVRGRNYHQKLEALEIIDLESGDVRLLCENGKLASWSPVVGGPIAFVRGTAPFQEIWLIEADATNPRKIADGGYPTWTRDGRLFYRVEGDTLKKLPSRLVSIHPGNPGVELSSRDINDKYPAVSIDGSLYATFNTHQLEVREIETGKLLASVPHPADASNLYRLGRSALL